MAKKQPPLDKASKLNQQAKQKMQEAKGHAQRPMSDDMDMDMDTEMGMGMEAPEDRPRRSDSPGSRR
ncbi:hypothetical protein [Streptomyces sp. NPDC097981]|uniref:hypothetical protein n=1 Tax=Streptomyces sp. NPDC097981 TaxID=3155428 RepID=UPI003317EE2A